MTEIGVHDVKFTNTKVVSLTVRNTEFSQGSCGRKMCIVDNLCFCPLPCALLAVSLDLAERGPLSGFLEYGAG